MNSPHLIIAKRYVRNRSFKSWPNDWLPFTWKRPEQQAGYFATGDQVDGVEPLSPQQTKTAAIEKALDLCKDDLPDEVRRQFTLEYGKAQDSKHKRIAQKITEMSGGLDENTLAGSIVRMTLRIQNARAQLRAQPNDVMSKVRICWWSDKRLKRLIALRMFDRTEFDRLVKELKLDLPKFELDGFMFQRIERKRELRRLTEEYCENLKQKKLQEYHTQLKQEQLAFEQEKADLQAWVEKELASLNINSSSIDDLKSK